MTLARVGDMRARSSSGTLRSVRVARLRRFGRRLAVRGVAPVTAAVVGGAAVAVVALVVVLLRDDLGAAAEALLLVLPVLATAVLGGRRPAQFAAALATLLLLLILPPTGSLRLRFTEDIVALVVFMVVAFAASGLVVVRLEVLGHLERQRAALLRSVSHDLRTPLAAISAGIAELEDESQHGPEARQRLLTLVGGEAARLDQMVGDLLSLARLEGGGLEPRLDLVDLGELVERCTRRVERVHPAPRVVVHVQAGVPPLDADPTLLEQVVTNLLQNAARHSPAGETVEVSVQGDGDQVWFTVSDAGPGIAPQDLPGIFAPFRSGSTAGTSGVGLAICEAVVEAHGGTIDVRESLRGGAEFTVVLPRR